MVSSIAPGESTEMMDPSRANENEDLKVFTLGVFNSANDVWEEIFRTQLNENYIHPTLVTFTDATVSECGGATESVGPFYCPADQK
ncbi:MAG: neutral zinc metallopeptidase, partial [Proteiniphilum sp.]|nr:neutral zinc metallopeptidase [Proteiniphilum sp.]